MYQKSPQNPEIRHKKSSLTLTRNILTLEIHYKIFFLIMKDPLKDYWFQVEIQKSPYGNIEIFARLDMTEKKLKVPFLLSLFVATLIFFLAILRPLRDLQTTTKKN